MADRAISELVAAERVTPADLFVLEQSGVAKKLTGQVLENWLVSFADGHGGIQKIEKVGTASLVDTYRITLADQTTFDFTVTNGKSITGISKTGTEGLRDDYTITFNDSSSTKFSVTNGKGIKEISKTNTSGLVDTYTIKFNDNTTTTFKVTNGAKGDKGDAMYVWIKYASQKPTTESHSFGDVIDRWIGIYSGNASTAPADWQQYKWFEIKGAKGDTGAAATLKSSKIEYQESTSGTAVPSGTWSTTIPNVAQGKYLWTRVTQQFNSGDPVVLYSVARSGRDGTGTVSTVAGVSPDLAGNVPLTAGDIQALAISGGTMSGNINMGGYLISNIRTPENDNDAVSKKSLLDLVYPVNSVYITLSRTSPAEIWGGTWTQITGRVLIGVGAPSTNNSNYFGAITGGWQIDNPGETGGQDYHTLTVDEMPEHSHTIPTVGDSGGTVSASIRWDYKLKDYGKPSTSKTGGNGKHNNMMPYFGAYIWYRVA